MTRKKFPFDLSLRTCASLQIGIKDFLFSFTFMIIFNIFSCHKIFYVFFSILFLNLLNLINFPCHHPHGDHQSNGKKTFFLFLRKRLLCLLVSSLQNSFHNLPMRKNHNFFFFFICFNNFFLFSSRKELFTKINKVDTICDRKLSQFSFLKRE